MSLSERYFSLLRPQWWSMFVQEPSRGKHPRLVILATSCFDVRHLLMPFFPLIKNQLSTISTIQKHKWENCSKPDRCWKIKRFGIHSSLLHKAAHREKHRRTGKKTFVPNSFELLSLGAQCPGLNTTLAEPMGKIAELWVRLSSLPGLLYIWSEAPSSHLPARLTPSHNLSLCTCKHHLRRTGLVPSAYYIWAGHVN